MHYVGRRASDTNPLRSLPLFRPAHRVLGWTPEQTTASLDAHRLTLARHALHSAEAAVTDAAEAYCQARREIGDANRGLWQGFRVRNLTPRRRGELRSLAFREFNKRLRLLRAAEKALSAAQIALAALAVGEA